jgi:hypothetical protein
MSSLNPSNTVALSQGFASFARPRWLARAGQWLQLSRWGAEGKDASSDLAASTDLVDGSDELLDETALPGPPGPRGGFLRRWSRRDDAIESLQGELSELMTGIRQHLERQAVRDDEIMKCLAHLPAALQQLPESARLQTDAIHAIRQHIEKQNAQQNHVGDILERMTQADAEHGRSLMALQERVGSLGHFDHAITENLGAVGTSIQTSALLLEQIKSTLSSRDGELERILNRQQSRFTAMLTVAICLSLAALGTVIVVGHLMTMSQQ